MELLFFIKKLITLLLLPLCISLFLLIFSIWSKKKRYSIISFFILFLFGNNIITEILWRIVEFPYERIKENKLKTSDFIVVLSSGRHKVRGKSGIIEWYDPDRFIAGIKLFKEKKGSKLLFTGGASPFKSNLATEGSIYIKEAIEMGVPKTSVLTTKKVYNTAHEAREIKKLINKISNSNNTSITLVTSAFHMHRAKRNFEKEGLKVQAYPVDFRSSEIKLISFLDPKNLLPNATALSSSSEALREIMGRIFYSF